MPRPTSKLPPAGPRRAADGLVLFNRFIQTDINPDTFSVSTGFKLSSPAGATLRPGRRSVMFEFPRAGTFVPTGSARISICSMMN